MGINLSTTRRVFILQLAATGTAAMAMTNAPAAPANAVGEKDANAVSLGYVADTTKVDAKKFPKHANDQKCSNCALYQGKAADAYGACPLFAGKQVAGTGWCSAWAKKA